VDPAAVELPIGLWLDERTRQRDSNQEYENSKTANLVDSIAFNYGARGKVGVREKRHTTRSFLNCNLGMFVGWLDVDCSFKCQITG
jgi:hypothetical protein